jgi:tetratricopeptide (TPR) repeat protein
LTLEVAFPGRDREELLRLIAFEEPHAPRYRNKAIPKELETIVLKTMEKSPEARYATAQELAEDLRRFLEDKPIRAKRPTLVQRAAKWGRRHKAAMRAAAAVLLLAIAGLVASTWLIWQEKEQTKSALAEARSNAARAQQNLDTAYTILDEVYVNMAEKRLLHEKELTPGDRQFLEKALTFYERFANQNSSDPNARLKSAGAYRRVAEIHEQLGQLEQSTAAREQGLVVSEKLAAEFPDHPEYRQDLARSYSGLSGRFGNLLLWYRPEVKVEQVFAKALGLQAQLVHEFPTNLDYQHDLGLTYSRLGYIQLYNRGRSPAAAEEPVRRALAIREKLVAKEPSVFIYRQELGMSLGNLGNLLTYTGRYQEAEDVVGRELKVRKELVDAFPAEPEARHFLADAYADLAQLLNRTGSVHEAAEAFRQEASLRKKLVAEFPSWRLPLVKLAVGNVELGDAFRKTGAQVEAIAAYEETISACKELIRRFPYEHDGYMCWGRAVAGMGAPNEAVAAWERAVQPGAEHAGVANGVAWFLATASEPRIQNPTQAVELAKKAVALQPQNAAFWKTLGAAYYRAGQWLNAVAALEKSMQLHSGGESFDWFFLAMSHWQLGDGYKARSWYGQAVRWMDKNNPQNEELRRLRAEAAVLLGIEEGSPRTQSAINRQRSAEKASTPRSTN